MEISQQIFRSIGMTLVHSLWQGAILAAVVMFLLALGRKSNARYRYGVLFTGLIMLLASFIVTFTVLFQRMHLTEGGPELLAATRLHAFGGEQVIASPLTITGKFLNYLEPFYPALAMGWLAGFAFLSLRMLGSSFYSRISLKRTLREPASELSGIFNSLSEALKLQGVRLYISDRMISPLVTGVFKPMVVIPAAAITGLSTEQISTIFIHELAHIARYDHVLIVIQAIARQVLFFHPLTWYLIPEIDRERENSCDDFVIRSQNSRINYIKALAMIQEMNLQGIPAGNHAGKRSKQLLNRISRLIKPEIRHSGVFRFSVVTVFIAAICLTSMALIVSDHHDVKNSPDGLASLVPDTTKKQKQDEKLKAANNVDKSSNRKKVEIVYENDSIAEMKVNGKKLTREEIAEYESKMHPELFSFNFDMPPLPAMPEFNPGDLEKLNTPEFREQMRKTQEEVRKAMEEAMKEHEFGNKEFQEHMKKFQEEQKENWKENQEEWKKEAEKFREHQDEWKLQAEKFRERQDEWKLQAEKFREQALKQQDYWNLHKEEWEQQMKIAREEAARAFEEMKKNGLVPPEWDMDSDKAAPRIHGVPPVPPTDIDIDVEAPEAPEIHEQPESVEPEDHSAEPADTGKSDTKELENKLQELEKE